MKKLIHEHFPVSRKEHHCMASDWLCNDLSFYWDEMLFHEKRSLIRAKNNNFKIKPGQVYVKQFIKNSDDVVFTFKAIPELHQICVRLDIYDQDY